MFNYKNNDFLKDIRIYSAYKEYPKYLLDLLELDKSNITFDETLQDMSSIGHSDIQFIGKKLGIKDLSVLICSDGKEMMFVSYCERKGYRYGIILRGDEGLSNYMGYISSPNCIFIIRSYFNPIAYQAAKFSKSHYKLLHIRGYCYDNYYDICKKNLRQEKDIPWFFSGLMFKSGRIDMVNAFFKFPGGKYLSTEQGFLKDEEKTTALKSEEYFKYMNRSFFVPCPMGWVNIDTQRIYETLDAGSIPVVTYNLSGQSIDPNYWSHIFNEKEIPCVIGTNWDEAVEKCKAIMSSNRYEQLNQKFQTFWANRQSTWKLKIKFFFNSLRSQKHTNSTNSVNPIALYNGDI